MPVERRKDPRLDMRVPVRVQGFDPDGREWQEMTATADASYGGASFPLKHVHNLGQVILLTLPLPRNFRRYALTDTSYRTYALIRVSRSSDSGPPVVGAMFLGRMPPRGFHANPGGRYLLPGDEAEAAQRGERRHYERHPLFINLKVRKAGDEQHVETTVTENLSRGGARVLSTLAVAAGDELVVTDPAGTARASAIVRHVFVGEDHVARLNLQFTDEASFARLLAAAGAPPLPD